MVNIYNNMDKEYFEEQIKGLLIIIEENNKPLFISRKYIKEKLNMILNDGINFNPIIQSKLKEHGKKERKKD